MAPVIIDNLTKFGLEFQSKIIAGILSDRTFLERIIDIIDITSFENESHQWILKESISYFQTYKDLPTLHVFKVRVDAITNEMLKMSVIDNLKSVFTKLTDKDLQFVRAQFLEFCKNQKLKNAIFNSVDFIKVGEYDKVKSMVDDALRAGMERNLGHDYQQDIEKRMSEVCRNTVPTGWSVIDQLMDGGLGPGEMGVIVGSAGGGKCVGPNTEIQIQYHETGVPIIGNSGKEYIMWFKPFDRIAFDGKVLMGWQIDNILFEMEKLKCRLLEAESV